LTAIAGGAQVWLVPRMTALQAAEAARRCVHQDADRGGAAFGARPAVTDRLSVEIAHASRESNRSAEFELRFLRLIYMV